MPALATWTPEDGVLGVVAPLGLAVAAPGSALVVDLDPGGPAYPGPGSLAELIVDEPRLADLAPARSGVAVLRNGGVAATEAASVVAAFVERWPFVVLRLPAQDAPGPVAAGAALVPVRPLLPLEVFPWDGRPAVHQRAGWSVRRPSPGPVLPRPRGATWPTLLSGRIPMASRWVRAWRAAWEFPWA